MWDEGVSELKNTRPDRMSLTLKATIFGAIGYATGLRDLIYLFKYKENCLCLHNQIDIEELTCI